MAESGSVKPEPGEPPLGAMGWAKAMAVGFGVVFVAGLALSYIWPASIDWNGVGSVLIYVLGGIVAGRVAGARSQRRWLVAFAGLLAMIFGFVLVVILAAIVVGPPA